MAKEYKVGERYYLPVTVAHVYDNDHSYPIHIVFNNGVSAAETLITDNADILLTAEEIISNILLDNNNFMTMPTKTVVVSEEEAKIKTLTEKIATLTDERDAAQGDLVTAREAIDYLQEENKKLKQELKDAEMSYNVVADTSIKRKNRVTTMEEVIVALVEKIRGLEGGET